MDNAVFLNKHDFTHLGLMLLCYGQRLDGTIGAYVATHGAIVVAEPFFKIYGGLHNAGYAVFHKGRFQYVRRTFADAQVARRTILLKVCQPD